MSRLLVICGPTASGKTDLAINLAKKFSSKGRPAFGWNGEVVSADSRQVYKRMDVGTGKDVGNVKCSAKGGSNVKSISNDKFSRQLAGPRQRRWQIGYYEIKGVKVWLYDIVKPDYQFNVADYKECADLVIGDILKRGKLPILVGGTGLYIKAVVDGIETIGVAPDWELRKRLLNCSIVELLNLLRRLDSKRAEQLNDSDRNNPRRLIRAIEVAKSIKYKVLSIKYKNKKSLRLTPFFIGLTAPLKALYQRIDQRVDERVKSGIEEEIKTLLNIGYSFEDSALGSTIGYREWQPYFQQTANSKQQTALKKEIIDKWKFNEHAYARRQMTWFKKDKRINWFDISKNDWEIKVEKSVEKWLSNMMR